MHVHRRILWMPALLLFALTACGNSTTNTANSETVPVLRYQGTANTVTVWELADDLGYMEGIELEWIGDGTSGPENIQATMTGDIEFGGAFNGAILQLQNAGAEITSVIHYYGSDEETYAGYYVLEDSPIETAEDLVNGNVGVNTLGAHHEFAVVEFARQSGLDEAQIDDVGRVIMPPASGEQALRSHQLEATTLSGIIRDKALETGGIRPLFKDIDLFGPFNAGSIVFRNDYFEENPEAVETFVSGTARAIEWMREQDQEEVRERMKDIIENRDRNENTELVEYWKGTGIESPGGIIREEDFERWIDWLVEDGSLTEDEVELDLLYDNQFNPYHN
ncbi:ABC transporter substrate-binding protein [Geomicrobium sp. JCM 19055]|uniref:ABC transporter substrate-binding protein n=1 Tax=Geomicrobium sp. JCM 19055 TaxID=1460649 RepID=UPI00045ECE79|nr:ABC transporter substrate-binding protein [Geomicrobium sp. JCM 19055]GAJ98425.1 possible ABC sulfonate transporter, substrate binding component [Geomicrobium sp. JCM 19055]